MKCARIVLVVLAAFASIANAMPTPEQAKKAEPLVLKLMGECQAALKSGAKTRTEVAESAMALAEKAESEAAKLLLMKGAYNLYVRAGEFEKAVDTLKRLQAAIPDIPPDNMANIVKASLRGVPSGECGRLAQILDATGGRTYCIIDLSGGPSATSYPVSYVSTAPGGTFNTDEYKTTKLVLRRIEPGEFIMGEDQKDETHRVKISKPFYIGVFEVTQSQYALVTGNNPSRFKAGMRPVERVSYNMIRGSSDGAQWPLSSAVDLYSFMGRLRACTGLDFDLPTEAQWEYACRAGTKSKYNNGGETEDDLEKVGRCVKRSKQSAVVGSYVPNAWGLYDMHGNMWEWCLDWTGALTFGMDPKGASSGTDRVFRGGGWSNVIASFCTSFFRGRNLPSYKGDNGGFRLALPLSDQ